MLCSRTGRGQLNVAGSARGGWPRRVATARQGQLPCTGLLPILHPRITAVGWVEPREAQQVSMHRFVGLRRKAAQPNLQNGLIDSASCIHELPVGWVEPREAQQGSMHRFVGLRRGAAQPNLRLRECIEQLLGLLECTCSALLELVPRGVQADQFHRDIRGRQRSDFGVIVRGVSSFSVQ